MKHKSFFLIGVAILFSCTSTFTSCINGVDDEYLDQKISGNDEANKDEESAIPDINGDYSTEGDYELKMTYNGYPLGGKKVIVQADDKFETATLTLAGTTKDLSALSNLLEGMGATFTTYSPIPGEKELIVKGVNLYRSGKHFKFEGTETRPTFTIAYEGQILDDVMTINITHELIREENNLLGAWKMGAVKEETNALNLLNNNDNDSSKSSPLFLNWGSEVKVNMGDVPTGMDFPATINVNRPMNGIFNLLMSQLVSSQFLKPSVEQAIPKFIEYIAAEKTGGMYASYSWTGVEAPEYSQDMSHNIIRYYFDKENVLRIDVDADYLLTSLGGLMGGLTRSTRADAQPDEAKAIGKELVNKLRPALEQGIPCEYTIDGNNMTININGLLLKDLLISIGKLLNDPFVQHNLGLEGIEGIGQYLNNVNLLIKNFPSALGSDCKYVKLGFHMVRK